MMGFDSLLFRLFLVTVASASLTLGEGNPCIPRDFDHGSIVCVCNATYCDSLEPLEQIPADQFVHVVSSKAGQRFDTTNGMIKPTASVPADVLITVNRSESFQKVIGFGGSFTDAATINIASLSQNLQTAILEAYYGKSGLQYNIGRINMAGCDFSTRLYSYDDVEGDEALENFALVEEDTDYKIPYVLQALKLNPNIKMFASPWTAPKWMKTNNEYFGYGFLKEEYYQTWANYFIKFLDEYAKHNVTFWALTAQNEPLDGTIPNFPFNCMGWTAAMQRDWIKNNLGPSLAASPHNATKIIILDDQRAIILNWARTILRDPEAAKYISGLGVHWYMDLYPASALDATNSEFPDYFIIGTEACTGSIPGEQAVILGSWARGMEYATDIIQDLNHWVTGWTDWNLVLDLTGGPNWEGNTVDAPIIVDKDLDLAYKQPMYYALGHFSKFIPEDSVRIAATSEDLQKLEVLAVQRPDESVAIVVLSRSLETVKLTINDPDVGIIEVGLEPQSLHTIVY